MTRPPSPGLGTWTNVMPKECCTTVSTALEMGYRHVDTAVSYRNQSYVGSALQDADVHRDEVYIASKVDLSEWEPGQIKSDVKQTLDEIQIEYLDLLYLNWPVGNYEAQPVFEEVADLVTEDVRNVGVSNFTRPLLREAIDVSAVPIVAVQLEMNPFCQQDSMRAFLRDNGIPLVACTPLARGRVFDVPLLIELAKKYGSNPVQITLAWLDTIDGVVPIPMSADKDHLEENFQARNINLQAEDRRRIEKLDLERKVIDPPYAPWNEY